MLHFNTFCREPTWLQESLASVLRPQGLSFMYRHWLTHLWGEVCAPLIHCSMSTDCGVCLLWCVQVGFKSLTRFFFFFFFFFVFAVKSHPFGSNFDSSYVSGPFLLTPTLSPCLPSLCGHVFWPSKKMHFTRSTPGSRTSVGFVRLRFCEPGERSCCFRGRCSKYVVCFVLIGRYRWELMLDEPVWSKLVLDDHCLLTLSGLLLLHV